MIYDSNENTRNYTRKEARTPPMSWFDIYLVSLFVCYVFVTWASELKSDYEMDSIVANVSLGNHSNSAEKNTHEGK